MQLLGVKLQGALRKLGLHWKNHDRQSLLVAANEARDSLNISIHSHARLVLRWRRRLNRQKSKPVVFFQVENVEPVQKGLGSHVDNVIEAGMEKQIRVERPQKTQMHLRFHGFRIEQRIDIV